MAIAHIDQKDVIWLSVDPLVDKYIDASPYVYCDGNPIKFLDPDGMDIFRYNKETGDITLYKKLTIVMINSENLNITERRENMNFGQIKTEASKHIKRILILFFITTIFYSCASTRNYDYVECKETPKEAVNIAVADYSKRLKWHNDLRNVSAVNIRITYTSTDWFIISMIPWIDEADKFSISELKENEGSIPPFWIPTEYAEINNVLYVWHNPNVVLTTDVIEKLKKYNLIAKAEDEGLTSLDGTRVCYIFCKTNYKKRYYRKLTVHYSTPIPSCRCGKSMDNN